MEDDLQKTCSEHKNCSPWQKVSVYQISLHITHSHYFVLCTLYTVLCTVLSAVYTLLSAVYTVLSAVYTVLCAVYTILSAVYTVLSAVYTVLCSVYTVLSAVYTILSVVWCVQYTLCSVHCTQCCVLPRIWMKFLPVLLYDTWNWGNEFGGDLIITTWLIGGHQLGVLKLVTPHK